MDICSYFYLKFLTSQEERTINDTSCIAYMTRQKAFFLK